ncbi:hypothetical protein SPRG_03687 [Saprolegnia parasitica CBS 223.65]|uniref:Transmembrane protein n=1 Tax=Saprolegnia parasitica (strain CBS 223.65) TaxID=695850 RepID=A0A067CYA0_SAPPC|nr:hypothetical protein SPRG_03687 [Saprolegnia parasitica CBS 223.65]KDO31767.1 hypothetical protein SPRG_03687 [Saprolegnia parasitica CBS 223.65]|eukprot:XP_012197647.1 hypothetical protein SPRG_03687 [Saprolegnia parasitica CBS 223.65]
MTASLAAAPHATLKGVACTQRRTAQKGWRVPPAVPAPIVYDGVRDVRDASDPWRQCALSIGILLFLLSVWRCVYSFDALALTGLALSCLGLSALASARHLDGTGKLVLDMREIVVVQNPTSPAWTSKQPDHLLDSDDEVVDFNRRTYSMQSTLDSECDSECDDDLRHSIASTVAVEDDEDTEDDLSDIELPDVSLPPAPAVLAIMPIARPPRPPTVALKRKLTPATTASPTTKYRAVSCAKPRTFGSRKLLTPALQRMLDEVEAMQDESDRLMAAMAHLGVHGPCSMNDRLRRWSLHSASPTPPL